MSARSRTPIAQLRGPILRSVSRSFYLSIRLLPAKLRDPIALAYLLARATDTIADTAEIDADLRAEELAKLARLIQENERSLTSENPFASIARLQQNASERALLEALPASLEWLHEIQPADRADIQSVLKEINQGQRLDLERFRNPAQVAALQTAAELEQYIYLVAGSVGEFWTRICARHLPQFASRSGDEMLSLGIAYGKGLQLINILRDVGTDIRAGRCYLPAEELHLLGVKPADLAADPERAKAILSAWLTRAEEGLGAGIEYACAINSWRVRFATALPALIGARTVALLRAAGPKAFEQRVKISRSEVRKILFRTVTNLASPRSLRSEFQEHLAS